MRIAVQASDLDHARIDGTRVYLHELLKRFGTLDKEADFLIYHKNIFNPVLTPPAYPRYVVKSMPFPIAWMQTRFAYELYSTRPEKLFLPIQAAPLFLPKGIEVTATIHDLAFKKFPETFPRGDRMKLDIMLSLAVKRAHKLIAVSESTKKDLLTYFPFLLESKVKVIHHGFNAEFFEHRVTHDECALVLGEYALRPHTYVLYVGALQPRKNLVRLIEAFEICKKTIPDMKLVLVGESAWLADTIHKVHDRSEYHKDIIFTGRLSFEAMRAMYQGARLFAFPSLYEGFGLPILEAFASQIPVLTADNSSLREVAGDAALYCEAENTEDIAVKLQTLWRDEELEKSLVEKGQKRLEMFSWDTCAKATLEYIQK